MKFLELLRKIRDKFARETQNLSYEEKQQYYEKRAIVTRKRLAAYLQRQKVEQ